MDAARPTSLRILRSPVALGGDGKVGGMWGARRGKQLRKQGCWDRAMRTTGTGENYEGIRRGVPGGAGSRLTEKLSGWLEDV